MRLAARCIPESLIDFFHSTKRERAWGRQRDHSGNGRWEEKKSLYNKLVTFVLQIHLFRRCFDASMNTLNGAGYGKVAGGMGVESVN